MIRIFGGLLLATAALAAPAQGRDNQFYVGAEAGAFFVPDIKSRGPDDISGGDERVTGNFKSGSDLGLIAGYDFGWFRVEGELSRKRAKFNSVTIENAFFPFLDGEKDTKGSLRARSAVINALVDVPVSDTVNLYAGPGIGHGSLKLTPKVDLFEDGRFGDELRRTQRKGLFGQLVGGVRIAVSDHLDAGFKYRYIRSEKLTYDAGVLGDLTGRLQTHSVLASLIYNFGGRAAEPVAEAPAPVVETSPPPPATQTCADGSVILTTDVCPAPPPAAPVTAGERG